MTSNWKYVDSNNEKTWFDLFDLIFTNKIPPNKIECPSCKTLDFHYFIIRHGSSNRGGCWLWCSSCYNYIHFSCIVPPWWIDINTVSMNVLTDYPEWLNSNLEKWEVFLLEN